ncbi:MAG TPA: PEP-CTERM sorting domain-containing protein [Candidatus Aquabacterium excrementipullorum]|nr:PEP-CTERM sorting domain-containing protein [Candidatus Aquabacterium excrementipullorum]
MSIHHRVVAIASLSVASAFAPLSATAAATTWNVTFEGSSAQGPLSGTLSFTLDAQTILEQKVLGNGDLQLTNEGYTFGWGNPQYKIIQGGSVQQDGLASVYVSAIRLADGTSQLALKWSLWPVSSSDGYGGNSSIYGTGGLNVTSSTDELFTSLFGPWNAVTAASGFTAVDIPAHSSCGRFTCTQIPASSSQTPFTITSISAVPEPGMLALLASGALCLGMSTAWRRRGQASAAA